MGRRLFSPPPTPQSCFTGGFLHFGSARIELFSPCICPMAGRRRATLLACVEKSAVVKIFPLARVCAVLGGFWFFLHGVQAAVPPLFVLNSLDANVSVIDPVTWTETTRIATGKEPHHLYLTPDEKSLIVANALGDTLTFVDPRTAQVQRTVRGI